MNNLLKLSDNCNILLEGEVNSILWFHCLEKFPYIIKSGEVDFDNDCFTIRPFNWNEYKNKDYKDITDWNFCHKESGIKIKWYKYPFRQPYCNTSISNVEFYNIIADCANSYQPNINLQSYFTVDKWWQKVNIKNNLKSYINKDTVIVGERRI